MRDRLWFLVVLLLAGVVTFALLPAKTPFDRDVRGTLTGGQDDQPRQTSDGLPGEIAAPIPSGMRARPRIDNERSWRIARGVRFRRWDQTDLRGQVRAYLVTINPAKAGVSVDYAMGDHVPERAPLPSLLARDDAVAGVNGGFFDIYDTGAPLGVGQDRERGFLHAAAYTWRNAFWIDDDGRPQIGVMPLSAQIVEYPQMEIANVNSPRVRETKIGIWDPAWGTTSGYSITDGQKKHVRMVVIEDGTVVANTTSLSSGREITGTVLVGRGPGADQLSLLRVGATATVEWSLAKDPAFAISGESILLRNRRIRVTDDRFLHPRTAVGIDRDRGRILLLAVDGRQPHSRGLTLVEEARMMRSLGAETALNLDGGGSTTLVGRNRQGVVKVLNRPSDGSLRSVPDGIAVLVDPPA